MEEKLRISPLAIDLVQEDIERSRQEQLSHEAKLRSGSVESSLNREIRSTVLSQDLLDDPIQMAQLRREKRELIQQFKQLRAIRDVERTNSRIYQISMKSK